MGCKAFELRGRRDLRPFDVLMRPSGDLSSPWKGYDVTVADPTRVGLVPSGSRYFKSGKAASRLVSKKTSRFKQLVQQHGLAKPAEFEAIGFEVTGGLGWHASRWFKQVCSTAEELGTGVPPGQSAWSASNFASYYAQQLSFSIVRLTALGVLNGIRRSMAESLGLRPEN